MAMSPDDLRLLDLALDRILPVDDAGAMRSFVRERAEIQPELYRAGLMLLRARAFDAVSPSEQDAVLAELEDHTSILLFVQHAVEGYYTSAAGLREVGFRVTA